MILIGLALSPCICCVGGILYIQNGLSKMSKTLPGDLKAMRDQGFITDISEMNPPIPDDQNAAGIYREVQAKVSDTPDAKQEMNAMHTLLIQQRSDPKFDPVAHWNAIQPILPIIAQAADLPHLQFKRDWTLGPRLMFPEYADLKNYAAALCYQASLQSRAGDKAGALKTILRVDRMAHQVGEERIMIAALVQINIDTLALRELQQFIVAHGSDPAALESARRTLAQFGPVPNLRYTINGEFVMSRYLIQNLDHFKGALSQQGDIDSASDRAQSLVLGSKAVREGLEATYVHATGTMLMALPKDPTDWQAADKVMQRTENAVDADHSVIGSLASIMIPVFSGIGNSIGRLITERRLTETGLKLYQVRNRKKAFPATLPMFGEVSTDPFSGRAFLYKPASSDFLLYSVGMDGHDDGGKGPRDNKDDIAFVRPSQESSPASTKSR